MNDIFKSGSEVLVNPVNYVGVMGAGLAKQFKDKYPKMYEQYKIDCDYGRYYPGHVLQYYVSSELTIICFATKKHWRSFSSIDWIINGIHELNNIMIFYGFKSVSIPRIGCGLGGLDWNEVKPIIINELNNNQFDIWLDGEIINGKRN